MSKKSFVSKKEIRRLIEKHRRLALQAEMADDWNKAAHHSYEVLTLKMCLEEYK